MQLKHLKLLLTLAKRGSLRAAAEELNVTQPALSKSLKKLEEEFGTTLVQRSVKGVRLTPAGELLAARAMTILSEIARARDDITWHLGDTTGHVAVGMSPAVAVLLAPGAITRFRNRWPNIKLHIRDAIYPHALQQLRNCELDFMLSPVPGLNAERDLTQQLFFHSPRVIVARRGHTLAQATHLAQLIDAHWVLMGSAGGPGDPAQLPFTASGFTPPRAEIECESFSTLLGLIATSDVIAITPRSFLDHYGHRVGLIALPIADPIPNAVIYSVVRSDSPLTLPAQNLLEAFSQEAREFETRPHS